jgi:hypothetical protein
MSRRRSVLLALCFLIFLSPRVWAAEAQWIVVSAPAFRDAVRPLCDQRKAQGFRVVVVQTSDILDAKQIRAGEAAKLRAHVNKLCRDFKGRSYVLLVGAIEAGKLPDAEKKMTPALRGTVSRMKGEPTDNGYGCPGPGLQPSVAVGRFPARTAEEAEQMVTKTLAYERDDQPGEWRRRLTVLAGIPAYNSFVDKIVEGLAVARFDKLDPSWTGRAIYHNPLSRFCVPDDCLHDRALDYVQAGQAFTLYLGHSNARGLFGGEARYLDREDWAKLTIKCGAGVFATFGCNGCQLSGDDGEGYGVAAMRNPVGPVAVLGSHGICFAAMVQLASEGLLTSAFAAKQPERLGAALLGLKAGLAKGKIDALTYQMLDGVDGNKKIPQATQRLEHLEMFVLLGDPALRLARLPMDVKLKIAGRATAGKTITVRGEAPARLAGAKVRLTVERPASSEPDDLEPLPREPGSKRDRVMLANHERANRLVLVTKEVSIRDGHFEVEVKLPAKLPYPRLLIRAYAATEKREGLGVVSLPLPTPK